MANEDSFDRALDAAVKTERQFREAERRMQSGLGAQPFLAEAVGQAGCDEAKLESLAAALNAPGHDKANAALQAMTRHICGEGSVGQKCSRPHKKIGFMLDNEGLAELASCGASALELFALAAKVAASTRPSAFGQVDNWSRCEREFEDLRAELGDAVAALETAWRPEDLVVPETGTAHFQRFPQVELSSRDLGRRLLNAALAESRSMAA